jgi:predicted TIM-barrel fold metal-dependent hydrolase
MHADLVPVGSDVPELSAADLAPRVERILFGSDAPNTPLTAGAGIARIRNYGLTPKDEAAVLGANALRLESEVLAG